MNRLSLVFMGTPDFAVSALAALVEAGHELRAVYTQPPRPAGRGQKDMPSPVQRYAEARGIPVRAPVSLKSAEEQESFAALKADVAVVAAYGLILPRPVLAAPRLGCINIHASLLPRWRGAAPIQRSILAGDKESGVTIMQMDVGLDTGPMLLRESLPIPDSMTAGQLHDALADMGARLIVSALDDLAEDRLRATPQPEEGVTYAAKIGKDEARLDWRLPAQELARKVRAFAPHPGAYFLKGAERIKVLEAAVENGAGAPGVALDDALLIACGEGALRLRTVQRAGKAAMAADAFLRGNRLAKGERVE